jgi:hypothetical protein
MQPMRRHVRIAIEGRTVRIARQMRELHGPSQRSVIIRDQRTHVAISSAPTERALNGARVFAQIVICASTANPGVESAVGRALARLRKDSLAKIAKPAKKNQRLRGQPFLVQSFNSFYLAILAVLAREISSIPRFQAQNECVNFSVAP